MTLSGKGRREERRRLDGPRPPAISPDSNLAVDGDPHGGHGSRDGRYMKRGGRSNKEKVLPSWRGKILTAFLVQLFFLQQYWLSELMGDDEIDFEPTSPERSRFPPPCPSIDTGSLRGGLVCVKKCTPSANNTIQGLGLDQHDRVNISMPRVLIQVPVTEYGKNRIYFPEEGIYLNLTGRLATMLRRAVEDAQGSGSIVDNGYMQPRPITERLLRRIVAKLLRTGVLDPSKDILTTGSWIGDNALPWAKLLENLRPKTPGRVVAVDPSEIFVKDMVDLANVNGIGNLCAQIGVMSRNLTKVVSLRKETEHIKVETKESIAKKTANARSRYNARGSWIDAITLDTLELHESFSLLHLDVEGHEGELLEGARETIQSSRPIIITEGFNVWPHPKDENDKRVLAVMNGLRYTQASEIPEYIGIKEDARNRIWWPDERAKDAALAVVGKELGRSVVPWIAFDLPEI